MDAADPQLSEAAGGHDDVAQSRGALCWESSSSFIRDDYSPWTALDVVRVSTRAVYYYVILRAVLPQILWGASQEPVSQYFMA